MDPATELLRQILGVEDPGERAQMVRVFGPAALVRSEVAALLKSSERLERLTRWLIGITVVLGVLTAVSVVQALAR